MLDKDDIRDDSFQLKEPERARTRSLVIDEPEPTIVNSENRGDHSGIYSSASSRLPKFNHIYTGRPVVCAEKPPIQNELSGMVESSGNAQRRTCLACDGAHARGRCPLRLSPVEFCGLCGLAHYGSSGRPCPHFRSMEHCRAMIEALKQSTEPRAVVELAKKYIYGVIGSISRKTKEQNEKLGSLDQVEVVQPPPRATASKKVKPSFTTRGNIVGHFANGLI